MTGKRLLGKLQFHSLRKRFMGLVIEGAEILILKKQIIKSALFLSKCIDLLDYEVVSGLRFFHFRLELTY